MAEWEVENANLSRVSTIRIGLTDLLDGSSTKDLIEAFEFLKVTFGENFEKIRDLDKQWLGKAYLKEVKTGSCRCGSCDDIYEWRWFVNR